MKAIFFKIGLVLFTVKTSFSQVIPGGNIAHQKGEVFWANQIVLTDVNGSTPKNKYPSIEGSPFFVDSWQNGYIRTNKNDTGFIQFKLDIKDQELHYLSTSNKVLIVHDGLIKELSIIDSQKNGKILYFFRTGYPFIEGQKEHFFYQVLSDGKVQLLKYNFKKIVEFKNDLSGETKKEFVHYEEYFVFRNGEIRGLKKNKNFIIEMMLDRQEKISNYLRDMKINFKDIKDLTNLFNYYNSL